MIAAMYEMMAEECCELAHACLKVARIVRGENPTPVKMREAKGRVIEEWSDLLLVGEVLGVKADETMIDHKLARWIKRLEDKEEVEE